MSYFYKKLSSYNGSLFNKGHSVLKYAFGFSSLLLAMVIFMATYFEVPRPVGSVIVPLQSDGELGNQMFRYATGYALAQQTGSKLYVMVTRADKDMNYTNPLYHFPFLMIHMNFAGLVCAHLLI